MDSTEEDIAWLKSTFHPIPKSTLPDDCIEYSLYIVDPKLDAKNDSETRLNLREVLKYSNLLQKQWLKNYIWQRQPFNLELVNENGEVCNSVQRKARGPSNTRAGLSFLNGRTEYGDSIEDEWVIVWLLRELTKKFSNLWLKVTDSDGEFLLIEASGTLPAWLEPEVAENRVWIHDGQLKIIKPAGNAKSTERTDEKISLEEAHRIIVSEPKRIMHSMSIEEEAFFRLRNYPEQIEKNIHHTVIRIPRKVAYLLLQKGAYVAPAIEAFYLRDPISLKPLQSTSTESNLTFPPTDLVQVSARFPRAGFAQVKCQDFPPPPCWQTLVQSAERPSDHTRLETGMKVTCGFEMLLADKQYQDRPAVREMLLLLSDLESGDAVLPSDDELANTELREDDESWLDIDFEDLQSELKGKGTSQGGPAKGTKKPEFGDKATQENLQRIVKQFEAFLNDDTLNEKDMFEEGDSDTEDIDDLDSDEFEEDKEISFGDDDFTKLMQEMMGMPPEVMQEIMKGKIDADPNTISPQVAQRAKAKVQAEKDATPLGKRVKDLDLDSSDDEEDEDIDEIMARIGKELKESGAIGSASVGPSNASGQPSIEAAKKGTVEEVDTSDEDDDEDSTGVINEQLVKNLIESFRAQGGMSGPASGLIGLLGGELDDDTLGSMKGKDKGKRNDVTKDKKDS